MKTTIQRRVRWFFLVWFVAAIVEVLASSVPARAQFGGGDESFRSECICATTRSASAGNCGRPESRLATSVHDQEHHGRRRGRMAVQPEPACESRWINQRTTRAFVHLSRTLAAVPAAISRLPSDQHSGSAESAGDDHNDAQHSQWCARICTGPGANLTPSRLRSSNSNSRIRPRSAIYKLFK